MIVYRLTQKEFAYQLTGEGARKFGGRWNSKGVYMLYTGETRALCSTEVAVHTPFGLVPQNYVMVSLLIPDTIVIETLSNSKLPDGWNQYPQIAKTQMIGNTFIQKQEYLVLKVPSATIDGEHNYLINPLHKMMLDIKVTDIKPFNFDSRLFIK